MNNCRDSIVADIMSSMVDTMLDHDYIKFFTVSVGVALEKFLEEMNEQNSPMLRNLDDSDIKPKKVDFSLNIMKCQPSSRNYCETTT